MGVKCTLVKNSKLTIPVEWIESAIRDSFEWVPPGEIDVLLLEKNGHGRAMYLRAFHVIEVTWSMRKEIDG